MPIYLRGELHDELSRLFHYEQIVQPQTTNLGSGVRISSGASRFQ